MNQLPHFIFASLSDTMGENELQQQSQPEKGWGERFMSRCVNYFSKVNILRRVSHIAFSPLNEI